MIQDRKEELMQYMHSHMEMLSAQSCRELQAVIDGDAGNGAWEELEDAVCVCLERAGELQERHLKGALQYLSFSLMQHGTCMGTPCLRIDAFDDGFWLDMQEAEAYYGASFLQESFRRDMDALWKKAGEKFMRMQRFERDLIAKQYAVQYYHPILFQLVDSLSGQIMEVVRQSGVPVTGRFKIIFGEYMGKAVSL